MFSFESDLSTNGEFSLRKDDPKGCGSRDAGLVVFSASFWNNRLFEMGFNVDTAFTGTLRGSIGDQEPDAGGSCILSRSESELRLFFFEAITAWFNEAPSSMLPSVSRASCELPGRERGSSEIRELDVVGPSRDIYGSDGVSCGGLSIDLDRVNDDLEMLPG